MIEQVSIAKGRLCVSRIGIGTGSNNGHVFDSLGKDHFMRVLRHAFDRGVTFVDTAQIYSTLGWVGEALHGYDRVRVQAKLSWIWREPVSVGVDKLRRTLGRDVLDSVLLHYMHLPKWVDVYRRQMDDLAGLRDKGIVRAIGVSCHNTEAMLALLPFTQWHDILLARANPYGIRMDAQAGESDLRPRESIGAALLAMQRVKVVTRCSVINMKVLGDGQLTDPGMRRQSLRWVLNNAVFDSIIAGLKTEAEVDELINNYEELTHAQ